MHPRAQRDTSSLQSSNSQALCLGLFREEESSRVGGSFYRSRPKLPLFVYRGVSVGRSGRCGSGCWSVMSAVIASMRASYCPQDTTKVLLHNLSSVSARSRLHSHKDDHIHHPPSGRSSRSESLVASSLPNRCTHPNSATVGDVRTHFVSISVGYIHARCVVSY